MCLIHSSHSLLREHFEQSVFFVDIEVCTLESVFLLATIAAFFNWSLVICVNIHVCLY